MPTLEDALNSKDFVLTSEALLGPRSGRSLIEEQADLFRGYVDGLLVTDNQSGQLHMSSLAASCLLLQAGIEPIMQLGCRNRNRVALLADLLGAFELGIRTIQVVRGERVPDGFVPRPKAQLDVTATELLRIAKKMRADDSIAACPELLLGCAATPRAPAPGWPARKLVEKVDCGARLVMLHPCMDIDIIRKYMKRLVALQLVQRTSVVASIAVLGSAKDALWLHRNKANAIIPQNIVSRLERADDPRREGIEIAAGMLQELAEIPGLSGAHVYAKTDLRAVPEVLQRAGLASGTG